MCRRQGAAKLLAAVPAERSAAAAASRLTKQSRYPGQCCGCQGLRKGTEVEGYPHYTGVKSAMLASSVFHKAIASV
jgi:hypothetical protein